MSTSIESLLGFSQAMEQVRDFAQKAAQVKVPVLILGETGTGKSLLGRVIHHQSSRSSAPYLAINCAGIPDSLFESEFFGHKRGAFTGAGEGRRGFIEQAQGGSLFLDEVGELSTSQQAKLLTALEEGEVRRLGAEVTLRVNVRVLAATSKDLGMEMRSGTFRRDLFHRLAVLVCHMPPLRERTEDIPVLVRRFVRKLQARHGLPETAVPEDSVEYLQCRAWPGNVRELAHVLEAALILSEGEGLDTDAIRGAEAMTVKALRGDGSSKEDVSPGAGPKGSGGSLSATKGERRRRYTFYGTPEEERETIMAALARARGNKSRAAQELGMSRTTLRQKLSGYRLQNR